MKILVLVKQVPKIENIYFTRDNTIDRSRSINMMNPADKCALLQALSVKKRICSEVLALSMGPPSARDVLYEAISLGADEAVLLSDPLFANADTFSTATILAAAIKKMKIDLILCGQKTTDGETGQVGPEIASMLGIPCISNVSALSLQEDKLFAKRIIDSRLQRIVCNMPCLLTVSVAQDFSILPSVSGARRAKSYELVVMDAKRLNLTADKVGISGSKTKVVKVYRNESGIRKPEFVYSVSEGVRTIANQIRIIETM